LINPTEKRLNKLLENKVMHNGKQVIKTSVKLLCDYALDCSARICIGTMSFLYPSLPFYNYIISCMWVSDCCFTQSEQFLSYIFYHDENTLLVTRWRCLHFARPNRLVLRSPPWLGWPLWNICVTNDHGYVPLVVNTSRSSPHSWLITGFVTWLTRRVPLVEQELLTHPEHMSSPPVFSGVRFTRSLVLCICFVNRCLSFCTFSCGHCLSVLRFTDSDYSFGIFKLFLFYVVPF
jgi:hypothetical protein